MNRANRITSRPDTPAPPMTCPGCDTALDYRRTLYGGGLANRWDFYKCGTCGYYRYEHQTGQLSLTTPLQDE